MTKNELKNLKEGSILYRMNTLFKKIILKCELIEQDGYGDYIVLENNEFYEVYTPEEMIEYFELDKSKCKIKKIIDEIKSYKDILKWLKKDRKRTKLKDILVFIEEDITKYKNKIIKKNEKIQKIKDKMKLKKDKTV